MNDDEAMAGPAASTGTPWNTASVLRGQLPPGSLWVFDEVHKSRRWRNCLEGDLDGRRAGRHMLVAGCGGLDLYRSGGGSLQGRAVDLPCFRDTDRRGSTSWSGGADVRQSCRVKVGGHVGNGAGQRR